MRSLFGNMLLFVISLSIVIQCFTCAALADRPPHFDYPVKLFNMETGYVLGRGGNARIGFGESGFGIQGRMQLTTNTLLDILTFVNGQVKVGLLVDDGSLPALATGFGYYNLVSSEYIVDHAVKEAFADREMDLSSGLECYYFFLSVSKRLSPKLRFHAGYQYRYLDGHVTSEEPFDLVSEGDTLSIYLTLDQSAIHRSLMTGVDVDLIDHLKIILEFGYDISYDRGRGGAGVRLGILQSFNLQFGALWPGMKLDEDIEIPVLPHVSMFWRF